MCRVRDWVEVHRLFEREGWSKTKIAGELGMSRNTADRLLALSEPPRYVRATTGSKLDPFRASILMMLVADATAPATVIIDRLRLEDHSGGITILKEYLREVRPVFIWARSYQRTSSRVSSLRVTSRRFPVSCGRDVVAGWGPGRSRSRPRTRPRTGDQQPNTYYTCGVSFARRIGSRRSEAHRRSAGGRRLCATILTGRGLRFRGGPVRCGRRR